MDSTALTSIPSKAKPTTIASNNDCMWLLYTVMAVETIWCFAPLWATGNRYLGHSALNIAGNFGETAELENRDWKDVGEYTLLPCCKGRGFISAHENQLNFTHDYRLISASRKDVVPHCKLHQGHNGRLDEGRLRLALSEMGRCYVATFTNSLGYLKLESTVPHEGFL